MRAVLTLHAVDDSGGVLSIAPSELASLVDAIAAAGHRIVPLDELLRHPGVPDRVALTFDDALASVADEALPILASRDLVATVFAVTDHVGADNRWPSQPASIPTLPTMGWGELEALRDAGWGIGSHGATHADPRAVSSGAFTEDVERAQAAITERLGAHADAFAWPYGHVVPACVPAVLAAHRWAFGGTLCPLDPAVDRPFDLPRLDAYYLRSPAVHRHFGNLAFDALLHSRSALRRLRRARAEGPCV